MLRANKQTDKGRRNKQQQYDDGRVNENRKNMHGTTKSLLIEGEMHGRRDEREKMDE